MQLAGFTSNKNRVYFSSKLDKSISAKSKNRFRAYILLFIDILESCLDSTGNYQILTRNFQFFEKIDLLKLCSLKEL